MVLFKAKQIMLQVAVGVLSTQKGRNVVPEPQRILSDDPAALYL
jgi:hypothetical protein